MCQEETVGRVRQEEGKEVEGPSVSLRRNNSSEHLPIEREAGRGSGQKAILRRFVRAQKRDWAARLSELSAEICSKVLASAIWQEAGTLLVYYPLSDEVDVRTLIEAAFESGRRVLLPVVKGEELELRLYEGEASLTKGAFGIMEPTGPLFAPDNYHEIELALIPGMAFDGAGHRLGRGKGFYDRLLPKLTNARLTGICFPFQFLDEVPAEPHDISVHEVIS